MSTSQSSQPLVPPPVTAEGFDLAAWGAQQNYWTERVRGGALIWHEGESWFANDPLGPLPHSHPDATEIYFVAHGTLEAGVGDESLELSAGDVCLIPPDLFHDPRGTAGTSLGLFCVVAPNWRDRRWQTEGFTPAAELPPPTVWSVGDAGPPPSDELLASELLELDPGESEEHGVVRGRERVLYVLSGRMALTIDNLAGEFGPHQYAHVGSNVRHRVESVGSEPLTCLAVWALDPAGDAGVEPTGPSKA
jgi:mannose-6-phosphate isomerase-like protein (cupin superfamily)